VLGAVRSLTALPFCEADHGPVIPSLNPASLGTYKQNLQSPDRKLYALEQIPTGLPLFQPGPKGLRANPPPATVWTHLLVLEKLALWSDD